MGDALSGFFGGSKQTSSPPPPPPAPSKDDAAAAAQAEFQTRLARQKAGGLEGTILTSAAGDTSAPNVGKKTLLGA